MGSMQVYLQKKSGEKMNKFSYKNLLKDSFIFAVGSFGSKVIVFFLIPYYTFYISKDDFGTYDLINTSVNLVFPIITLAIYESTLRFNLEENIDKSSILSNSIFIFVIGSIFTLAASTLSIIIFNLNIMISISTCLLILLNAFQKILVQYIRGIKKVKLFVINGVIISILTSLMSILLVGVLKLELKGILYASMISIFISNIYLLKFSNLYKMIQVSKIDFSMLKNMLKYSIPLIPNTLSLWITSSSNRFFILFFLGSSSNGLFAVAYKFAAIMTLINSFFFQAWQIVASEQYTSKNRNEIYENVFKYFSFIMITAGSLLIIIVKPLFEMVTDDAYSSAWKLVPYLIVGSIISGFSSFVGTNYSAAKNTVGVFKTTIIGAIINTILCIILIPINGLYGVCISFALSYFVIFVVRINDTNKILKSNQSFFSTYVLILILFMQASIRILELNVYLQYVFQVILFFSITYSFKGNYQKIAVNIKKKRVS